jgi:hypothetical protein
MSKPADGRHEHLNMQIRITPVVMLLTTLFKSQLAAPQQLSPAVAANEFCQRDSIGKRLNAPGATEFAKELLLRESPWEQPSEIVIVKDCSVQALPAQKDVTAFALDYHVLGRINSSLSLARLQMPYAGRPLTQSERLSLVLTDTHFELANDGRVQPVKGIPEWRIKSYPATPHVSVAAAMQYVRAASHRSRDISVKMNAEKALMELQNLQMPTLAQAGGLQQQPQEILSQFVEMELDGQGLNEESSRRLDVFFLHPGSRLPGKIGIARGYAIKKTSFSGNNATVHVEYGALGELDPQLRFVTTGPNGSVVHQDYKLVLDNKYSAPTVGNTPAHEFVGPTRWQIEEAPAEQWISVAAAIRHVTLVLESTRDPIIKNDADKTLAILNGIQ